MRLRHDHEHAKQRSHPMSILRLCRPAVAFALGGPVSLGLALGLPFGLRIALGRAALLPALVLGLALTMAPALYIALSLAHAAPAAARLVDAVGRSLRACGTVMAGLAPAAAFLAVTSPSRWVVLALGVVSVAGAVLIGLRALAAQLFDERSPRSRGMSVLVPWATVALGLGAHLLVTALAS
jgi:hypothetical protein